MTIATPDALPALPTVLPRVERRAAIPAGFRAGGASAGIKASGRPDLAIVALEPGPSGERRTASAAAVFTPNAFAAAPVRLSQAHLAATSPPGRGRFGYADAIVSTSGSANAATGAAGDADQIAIAKMLAAAVGAPVERT
ncbi:MAG TPA: bifunctional ornithine acetyltransferase/N-acetylglutamate synthase, partial [Candidatus Limnocylindrales bacterium]|nr:bifunctional ornithine acetyltransferase/N-acetylglutamate synthase [Candidatus Limnocylindrales bacterium]